MISVDGCDDYLDWVFSSQYVSTISRLSGADTTNNQQKKSSRKKCDSITYADRVRDKVSTLSKSKNSRESNINIYFRDKVIAEKLAHTSSSRPRSVLSSISSNFNKTDFTAPNDINRLHKATFEFRRYCKLRDAFGQQLQFFFSSYNGLHHNFETEGESFGGPQDVNCSIERGQFFSIIVALRRSSVRIVECYEIVCKFCEMNASKAANDSVEEMKNVLSAIVKSTFFDIFPEPFNSWMAISREKNIFFMAKTIDGRRAIHNNTCSATVTVKEKPTLKCPSQSIIKRAYPPELQLSKQEIKRIEFLSNLLRKILSTQSTEDECSYSACSVRYDKKEAMTHTVTHRDCSLSRIKNSSVHYSVPSTVKNIPRILTEFPNDHGYTERIEVQKQEEKEKEEQRSGMRESEDRADTCSPELQPSLSYSPSSLSMSSSTSSPRPSASNRKGLRPDSSVRVRANAGTEELLAERCSAASIPSFDPSQSSLMSLESSRSMVRPTRTLVEDVEDNIVTQLLPLSLTLPLTLPPPLSLSFPHSLNLHDSPPPLSSFIAQLKMNGESIKSMLSSFKERLEVDEEVEEEVEVEDSQERGQLHLDSQKTILKVDIDGRNEVRETLEREEEEQNRLDEEYEKEKVMNEKEEKEREEILPKQLVEMLQAMEKDEEKLEAKQGQRKPKREKQVRRRSRLQRCLDCQYLVAHSIDFSVYSDAETVEK